MSFDITRFARTPNICSGSRLKLAVLAFDVDFGSN